MGRAGPAVAQGAAPRGAEAGDASAWAVLVQRMAPALTHAPQPFITAGQGSEAGDGRKGVRRTPKSALAALTLAYTATSARASAGPFSSRSRGPCWSTQTQLGLRRWKTVSL